MYVSLFNLFLHNFEKLRKKKFKLMNFCIINLDTNLNILEYLENCVVLKDLIAPIPNYIQDQEEQNNKPITDIKKNFLYKKYKNKNIFLDKLNTYVSSVTIWSFFGYLIGLGDLNLDNISLHQESAQILDFDLIFNTGSKLPVPENIHFRMKNAIQNSLDLTQTWGFFYSYFEFLGIEFEKNIDIIFEFLNIFNIDPIIGENNENNNLRFSDVQFVKNKLTNFKSELEKIKKKKGKMKEICKIILNRN
jgi:phosphatidylinositol kinase/protein kinase (PI-3  family)